MKISNMLPILVARRNALRDVMLSLSAYVNNADNKDSLLPELRGVLNVVTVAEDSLSSIVEKIKAQAAKPVRERFYKFTPEGEMVEVTDATQIAELLRDAAKATEMVSYTESA